MTLRALGQTVPLSYRELDGSRMRLRRQGDACEVCWDGADREGVFELLRGEVKKRARAFFSERLPVLSEETGLPFSRIAVRGQRTRWGSYSATGTVSLNFKLLFLPLELVDHILLHELCHARHRNHSARFHALLASIDPDAEQHSRALRRSEQWIPDWVERY